MSRLVPAGTPLPFEYTSYDGISSLNIGMTVIELTGGPPTVLNPGAPIPMVHAFNGTYIGYFTPMPGKSYVIHKMVYTDNTFAFLNQNYSPGSEGITTHVDSIVAQIWSFDISSIALASSAAFKLFSLPTAVQIAAAVWSALRAPYAAVTGSFGEALQGLLTPARAAALDNLDMPISSITSGGSLADFEFVVGLVEDDQEIIGIVEDV